MNSEERQLLTAFLDQLAEVKGIAKDPDAASLISAAAARQPDAVYLLVQKALLQEQALNAAQSRIADLQTRLDQAQTQVRGGAPRSGGFLGNDPWAAAARPAPAPAAPWPAAAPPSGFGGMGSFLGTAAATAAGIAGGAFLFQGIENLMGHHHGSGGFFDTADRDPDQAGNITINEYYGNDGDSRDQGLQDADFDLSDDGFDAYDDDDDGSLSV